jgi:hypothetical protein
MDSITRCPWAFYGPFWRRRSWKGELSEGGTCSSVSSSTIFNVGGNINKILEKHPKRAYYYTSNGFQLPRAVPGNPVSVGSAPQNVSNRKVFCLWLFDIRFERISCGIWGFSIGLRRKKSVKLIYATKCNEWVLKVISIYADFDAMSCLIVWCMTLSTRNLFKDCSQSWYYCNPTCSHLAGSNILKKILFEIISWLE